MSKLTLKTKLVVSPPLLQSGFTYGGFLDRTIPHGSESSRKRAPHGNSRVQSRQTQEEIDRYWMTEALIESMNGIGITQPNPAVGCILVDSKGQEISRGSTQAYRGEHAEKVAFKKIQDPDALKEATAYVTLEPCSHIGHQPPCVDLFLASPIRRIVIACTDPNPLVNGEGLQKLMKTGKKVVTGVLGPEAAAWNFPFFSYQRLKRPAVILKWAQTLDGQLADDEQNSQWITGPSARSYSHWLRQHYDLILVGARTALSDFPRLDVRDCALPHQAQPLPVIFDPRGLCLRADPTTQTQLKTKTFTQERPVFYISTRESLEKRHWLENLKNVRSLALTSSPESEAHLITELMETLASASVEKQLGRPLQSLFVEGGPSTLRLFLQSGYADLLHVLTAPLVTGGQKNRIALSRSLKEGAHFQINATATLGRDQLTELTPFR